MQKLAGDIPKNEAEALAKSKKSWNVSVTFPIHSKFRKFCRVSVQFQGMPSRKIGCMEGNTRYEGRDKPKCNGNRKWETGRGSKARCDRVLDQFTSTSAIYYFYALKYTSDFFLFFTPMKWLLSPKFDFTFFPAEDSTRGWHLRSKGRFNANLNREKLSL